MDRRGNSSAAVNEIGTGFSVKPHDRSVSEKSSELTEVTYRFTPHGYNPDSGSLIVDHSDRDLVGYDARNR